MALKDNFNLWDWILAILLFCAGILLMCSCQPDAILTVKYQRTEIDSEGKEYLPLGMDAYFDARGSSKYTSARIDVKCCSGTKTFGETGTAFWCTAGTYTATLKIKDTHGNTDSDQLQIIVK